MEEETPFYRRPMFWVVVWIVVLLGLYAYQVFSEGTLSSVFGVVCNSILLAALFPLWMAFYAQFILPINTLEGRSKIRQRLSRYMSRSHGPAIFIQNGRVVAKEGELERKRAGVIWLDTASAAVTRTMTAYKKVIGPGVHFTDDGEYLAGWLDLHTQVQSLGPKEGDRPFDKLPENPDDATRAKFKDVQERRTAVSGLTRDGIEIIPNITVVFKIDAQPATEGEPGSHFGFDENAVFKAISKEGINPNAKEDARRVAWNQLPALIAADLWREFAAKFTLAQFFEASQTTLSEIPQPEPPPAEIELPPPLPGRAGFFARILRYINNSIEDRLEDTDTEKNAEEQPSVSGMPFSSPSKDTKAKTALQIITQLIKMRMTQELVPALDESGRPLDDPAFSDEFKKLQERGLKVIGVSVGSLRLPPEIEERSIKEWNANWLVNAQAERKRIERRTSFVAEDGKRTALLDYANDLSRGLIKARPRTIEAALVALLERSRNEIIRDDSVRQRLNAEPSNKDKERGDLAPTLLSLLQQRSSKETASFVSTGSGSETGADGNIEAIDQIIERTESNDL